MAHKVVRTTWIGSATTASRSVLASDAERDATVERLRHAEVEGRLTPEELSQRVGDALRHRTRADLACLLQDLPEPSLRDGRAGFDRQKRKQAAISTKFVAAVCSGAVALLFSLCMLVPNGSHSSVPAPSHLQEPTNLAEAYPYQPVRFRCVIVYGPNGEVLSQISTAKARTDVVPQADGETQTAVAYITPRGKLKHLLTTDEVAVSTTPCPHR